MRRRGVSEERRRGASEKRRRGVSEERRRCGQKVARASARRSGARPPLDRKRANMSPERATDMRRLAFCRPSGPVTVFFVIQRPARLALAPGYLLCAFGASACWFQDPRTELNPAALCAELGTPELLCIRADEPRRSYCAFERSWARRSSHQAGFWPCCWTNVA
jgi:hypothetical protein